MRSITRKKGIAAATLALVLLLCGLLQLPALAINTIDVNKTCSLTVSVGEQYPELKEEDLSVRLYRVAPINRDGTVPEVEGAFSGIDMSRFSEESSAEELEAFTEELAERVKTASVTENALVTLKGTAAVTDLPTGLYLVITETVRIGEFGYVFQPSLISLPTTEAADGLNVLTYDAALVLKVSREELFGSVQIEKILDSFSPDQPNPVFVFSIEAVKDEEVVFSDVRSMFFDGAGTQYLVVDHIPAGAQVTVTELYSGAGYKLTSDPSVTLEVGMGQEGEELPTASFTNTHDGSGGGSGILNHFEYDEQNKAWTWVQMPRVETDES